MGEKNMLKKIKHQNNKKLIAILICLFLAITSFCIYISFIEDEEKKEKPIISDSSFSLFIFQFERRI